MTGVTQAVHYTQTLEHSQLGGESYFNVTIYAVNDLGSSSLTMVKVTATEGKALAYCVCVCLCVCVCACGLL